MRGPCAIVLVRLTVGAVFFEKDVQKLLFADLAWAGWFARIGIPAPEMMGPFVGTVEIPCGALILAVFLTRLAAIPVLVDILVAILSTQTLILLGHDMLCFHVLNLGQLGFGSMASEARADFCMLLGLVFLPVTGAGPVFADTNLNPNPKNKIHE